MSVRITQLSDFPLICFLVLVSEDHYFKAMCSLSANQFWNKTALRGEKRETEKDRPVSYTHLTLPTKIGV